ncbi:MAG: hypothetical protein A2381_06270 [Bdellovibrionales bacterium RIFOXYB1_FULL_37_110]|nr:MAG: hypothetical protein A2417_02545 [Bdellovibrionales bacterium RIFOXYC1_FULL_37_79]OFZ60110.1 MAG: hypothetical protein A2381_06270 [Bdellovibrionales bacterium RIFOXYB1_FULL_37_110]OFZ63427.1 MAG: hypothetical protein A2577_00015 [Bdellovibrionales bacterium RIFOXYD1_FULL_36_51]
MKKIIFTALFILATNAFSGELTGAGAALKVLERNNITLHDLTVSGRQLVELGEVTGASDSINVEDIEMFVTGDSCIESFEAKLIFNNPNRGLIFKDIDSILAKGKMIKVKEIKGLVVIK